MRKIYIALAIGITSLIVLSLCALVPRPEKKTPVSLAYASNAKIPYGDSRLSVTINNDGQIYFQGAELSTSQFEEKFQTALKNYQPTCMCKKCITFDIRVDSECKYKDIQPVIDIIQNSDIIRIAFKVNEIK